MKKLMILLCGLLMLFLIPACGAKKSEERPFLYLTSGYGISMGDAGVNPHKNYSGWSAVRYGIGETLFRFSDTMQVEPWLAEKYQYLSPTELKIWLRDDVYFTDGRKMDGTAVKECLEDLINALPRAKNDLKIRSITADGNTVTIETLEPSPILPQLLADPYAAIVDMQHGVSDHDISGTGPYKAERVTDREIHLVRNPSYWGGMPKIPKIIVKSMPDSFTMTASMQSGIANACYGLPIDSYPLYSDLHLFHKSTSPSARTIMLQWNPNSEIAKDPKIREALSFAVNKKELVQTILRGEGTAAKGPFPDFLPFGDQFIHGDSYDLEKAKKILADDGWTDTDGDGYIDKNGEDLTIRWLTYPGRAELPILAQVMQEKLKQIGIKTEIESSAAYSNALKDGEYDIFAGTMNTAPTGNPIYFFANCVLDNDLYKKDNEEGRLMQRLGKQLMTAENPEEMNDAAVEMTRLLVQNRYMIFIAHMNTSLVMKSSVTGLKAHPSDYYEITADLGENR